MKCEFCERKFDKGPVEKVVRGERHIFCSQGCFNLYFYNMPKLDFERMYSTYCESALAPDFRELIKEEEQTK
jgi:hypothetical protein